VSGPLPGGDHPPPPGQAGVYRRFVAGAAGKAISLVIQFAEQFLLVPVFLLHWGADGYSDWLVLMSAAGFVAMLDMGLQAYFGNALQMVWARGEREAFRRMLHNGLAVYAVITAVALPVVVGGALAGAWRGWLNLQGPGAPSASAALALLGLYMLVSIPLGIVFQIYRARGDYALGVMITNARRIVTIVAIVAVLWCGGGMAALASTFLGLSLAFWIALVVHQKRRYPDLAFGLALPDRAVLRELAAVCPFYAVLPVAMTVTLQGSVILISTLAAAGAGVVAFTTIRTLCGMARMVAMEIGNVPGIEIARQYAQGDMAALARMYRFTGRLAGGLCGGLAGMIAVIGPPFLEIWTLGRVPFDGAVFWPLLAAAAAAGPAIAGTKMMEYNNRPRALAGAHAAAGAVTLALCLALIPSMGAAGAAWAVLAAEICALGVPIPWFAARIAGLSPPAFIATTHGFAALSFVVSTAVAYAAVALTGDGSLARLIAAGAVWTVAAALAAPWLLVGSGHRRGLFERLRRRLPGG
jgi:O-antigen/teichoic acid export membrane protein